MQELDPELEAFRQKWREEVSARAQESSKSKSSAADPSKSKGGGKPLARSRLPTSHTTKFVEAHDDGIESQTFGGSDEPDPSGSNYVEPLSSGEGESVPESALGYYERAVERENQGSLGDSLNLYRKAFRMDDRVDQKYKNKHFPKSSFVSKPGNRNPSNAAATVPNTAHHSLHGPPQSIKQLISGFFGLSIEPMPPPIEGAPAPPCPMAGLPSEIITHIMLEVAVLDIGSFVRLAQVCKRMAYVVLTEEQIWRRVCMGSEFGFGAMHYEWQQEVLGGPLDDYPPDIKDLDNDEVALAPAARLNKEEATELLHSAYESSWQQMFRLRPRIRFNGCYISTVNYPRPGQASVSQVTWHSPVHIVTYYRYLRFFRDGTVISLLTTDEPADVVHCLTKDFQDTHRGGGSSYLPSAVMQHSLRGRWRLSSAKDTPDIDLKESEGGLFIETEGVSPKYMYRMDLSLRSSGRVARQNKLVWRGFWSYNVLTDDSGEFTLRNEKPFFFSRVKSYGNGA
ncbi:uncharacterized protein BP5553_08719 [Venustampulla echinocandica]|uniref:F-box domain-containing protein n=1 Tax=Venustampulla echinocandica TaxID=2656787 RepID=A0A370TF48_9HELO|nr:uncharacterized protein BP5553_08719 [Venustampulla echinocandica]RDL33280.1 hypothetical protein BP5553_08719 [Venustampulla echinocandica]